MMLTLHVLALAGIIHGNAGRVEGGQVARGARIFSQQCSLCHDDSQHMVNDNGPALFGVVGRRVGSVDGYSYSPALQRAGQSGDVWTVKRLDQFLTGPEAMYAGTGMPMHFRTSQERAAIIAYLKTLRTKN
ncbi:c-type cytochrome [Asticcacaulis sp. 201]|uniref:c-type cytochrome n=1 Tax=Asticcacaulis sp. 201 TaxID=3028787 RepID=UPI0029160BF1|nr:c-type cytochrome [Asticcacaulis sp. 201]MDV6333053.1 c-type cytochrome [Asticcacaulis sp. 201]